MKVLPDSIHGLRALLERAWSEPLGGAAAELRGKTDAVLDALETAWKERDAARAEVQTLREAPCESCQQSQTALQVTEGERDAAVAQAERAESLLRTLEWAKCDQFSSPDGGGCCGEGARCPVCDVDRWTLHDPGCELNAIVNRKGGA